MSVFRQLQEGRGGISGQGVFSQLRAREEEERRQRHREMMQPIMSLPSLSTTPLREMPGLRDLPVTPPQPERRGFFESIRSTLTNPDLWKEGLKNTYESLGSSVRGAVPAPVRRAADTAVDQFLPNRAPLGRREDGSYGHLPGPSVRELFRETNPKTETGIGWLDTTADVVGTIGSYFHNPSAPGLGPLSLYNAAGTRVAGEKAASLAERATRSSIAPNIASNLAPRMAREAAREGLSAAAYAPMHSILTGRDSPSEIAQNVALEGGLGAGIGGVMPVIGQGVRRALDALFKNRQAPEAVQQILALPEPRQRGNVNQVETPDVIHVPETGPRGLPEPEFQPTRARVETRPNEYRQKFERLIEVANQQEFPPGRELEELEDLWSRMASPEDPSLDELIDLAYPSQTRRISPNALERGRMAQVAGLGPNIRRAPQPEVTGFVSDPESRFVTQNRRPVERTENISVEPEGGSLRRAVETLDGGGSQTVDVEIIPPNRQRDPVLVGAAKVVDGTYEFPRWSEQMVQEFGEEIRPRLEEIYDQSRNYIFENRNKRSIMDDLREIAEELSSRNLGIAAGTRKPKPYENVSTSTKSQLVTKLDREPFSISDLKDKLYTGFIDDVHRMNQFDKFAEEVLGKLKPTERMHSLAMASRGSDIISNQIITHALVDSAGNEVGRSLKGVLERLPRGSFVDFEDYLVNRHAITRHARGEKVFSDDLKWTPEKGEQIIRRYEEQYPEFKQAAEEYYEFNNNMVKNWLVDTGLLTPEQANQWVTENPFYVPMKRHFSDLEKASGTLRARRGFADQKAPVKGYQKGGSQRKIYSPIESTIENVDAFVKSAKRNQVMQSMVRNIRRDPDAFKEWAEIIPSNETVDMQKVLSDEGIDGLVTQLNDEFESATKSFRLDRDNVVRVMMDGEPVHVKINDKMLLDSIKSLNPEGSVWLLDAMGQLTRVFKVLTTGANPIFGLLRNLPRDVSQAFIARKNSRNLREFAGDLLDSFVQSLGNRSIYQSYKNIGGGHSSPIAADRNLLAQSKRSVLPQNRLKGAIPKGFAALENFMNALETVPRLGEYKRASGSGVDRRLGGLLDAQDITVNFKRKGKWARDIDKVFPYFNAAMQGVDKLARMYKDNPVQAGIRSFMAITVPTIALYALNYNNPEFQKMSKYQRDNYFQIPDGKGEFFKIAKHRELGIPFSAAIERVLDAWLKDDPEAFREFAEAVNTAFVPPGVSGLLSGDSMTDRVLGGLSDTIGGPFLDVARNQTFTGAPIVPANLQRLSPELQYDERTSEISKYLGRLTGTSPKQLDHLIRSYTGVVGQLGLPATTKGASVTDVLSRQITVDPVYSTDAQSIFYENKEKLDQAYHDFNATGQQSKHYNEGMRKVFNHVSNLMSDLNAAAREIENSDLPSKDKQKYMREIRARINDLARATNEVYRSNK